MARAVLLAACLALTLLIAAPAALASQRFAAPSPAGTGDCGTVNDPCDIVTAVNNANANDEVILASGNYGSSAAPVNMTLLPNDTGLVVHGAPGAGRPVLFSNAAAGVSVSGSAELRDLEIRYSGGSAALQMATGATADRVIATTATGSHACLLAGGTVQDSVCRNTKPGGNPNAAEVTSATNATGNLINVTAIATDPTGRGIEASTSGAGNAVVLNATNVIARGDSGQTGTGGDVFANTTAAGASATVDIDFSNFREAMAAGSGTESIDAPASGNNQPITTIPVFANEATGDFHQLSSSPTINAGSNSVSPSTQDFDGDTRFSNGTADIGADEFVTPPARFGAPTPSGAMNCSSIANACDIQTAVELANSGDDVTLAAGTYTIGNTAADRIDVQPDVVVHGTAGGPRPKLVASLATNVVLLNSPASVLRDVEVEQNGAGTAVKAFAGTIDGIVVTMAGSGSPACEIASGTLRNSVCHNTSASAGSIGAKMLTSITGTGTMRNVTAVTEVASGVGIQVLETGAAATATLNATNVIAQGAAADVGAQATMVGSAAVLNLDHSNYATVAAASGSGTGTVTAPGTTNGNQTATPLLSADFHELTGSPTINAGIDDGANGPFDFEGNARDLDGTTDIGADEAPVPGTGPGPDTGTGTGTGGGGLQSGPGADVVKPAVAGLGTSPGTFAAAAKGGSVVAKTKVGTRVSYSLSEAATVTFTVERRKAGRRVKGKCRKPSRANRKRKKCDLLLKGSFKHAGKAGRNSFRFRGRLKGRKLKPGRYNLVASARDAAGNVSIRKRASFRIVK